MSAKTRYDSLASQRSQFLNIAEEAGKLTIPYLIRGEEEFMQGAKNLSTPWQSVGAKGVVTLAAKQEFNTEQSKIQVPTQPLATQAVGQRLTDTSAKGVKMKRSKAATSTGPRGTKQLGREQQTKSLNI